MYNDRIRKRIRVDPSNSPLNLMKKKINEKNEKEVFEDRVENIEEVIVRSEMISKRNVSEQKRDELLKMMYYDDIDADHVLDTMQISNGELESIVGELIELGFIQNSSNDEVELTMDGIFYIMNQDPKFFK